MLSLLLIEALKGALLGGVIGWATNAVAVKMLFRPHRGLRFFGMKVPLTPGLVVKNKERLAEAIGSAVARELLDSHTIMEHLRELDLRGPIAAVLADERKQLLLREESLATAFGDDHREALETIRTRLAAAIATKVSQIAAQATHGDPAFEETLRVALGGILDEPISSHLTGEQRGELREVALRHLKLLAEREDAATLVHDTAFKALAAFPESEAFSTLERLAQEYLNGRIPSVVAGLQESLAEYVEGPSFADRAKDLIARKLQAMIVEKFPMAKLLVNERMMNDLVQNAWPDLLSELQDIARGEDLQQFLSTQIDNGARNFVESIREAVGDAETTGKAASWIVEEAKKGAAAALEDGRGIAAVDAMLDGVLAKSPRQLITQFDDLLAGVVARVAKEAAAWLAGEDGRRWVEQRAASVIDDILFRQPVSALVSALPEEDWERGSSFLAGVLHDRALRAVPSILENQIDLQAIVSRKIEDFETTQLEDVITRVSGSELKGIVRLGGLIGVVVGAGTQVVYYFLR